MTRPLRAWIAFGLCFLLGLAAMGWISREVIRLDLSERQAREQAAVEEGARLALWRMDSALTTLIAQESSRPHFFYWSSRGPVKGKGDEASPLIADVAPNVLIHFQLEADGRITSPQVPVEKGAALLPGGLGREKRELFAKRLSELQALVPPDTLRREIPIEEPGPAMAGGEAQALGSQPAPQSQVPQESQQAGDVQLSQEGQSEQHSAQGQYSQSQARQSLLNTREQRARAGNVQEFNRSLQAQAAGLIPGGISVGRMQPVWIGETLVLARSVTVSGSSAIQGLWLDWPGLKTWLLALVEDLFPRASLEPASPEPGDRETRRLAALPVLLIPGPASFPSADGWSPLRISLLIAWSCVLLGAGAAALLLKGVMALSERRGAFVSAVTHELRTPLTTFRMYTEMLASGMVLEEEKRRSYLTTLSREADRLGHLVLNVLAYSRLEKGRPGAQAETVALEDLLERVAGRLEERAEQAGMVLVREGSGEGLRARVRVDVSAVDQILFNLVDNACKYAGKASDRRIHLEARLAGKRAVLRVRDHGPGIPAAEARRLFRPFSKSAREAANSAPGVGLGLALSRRLARVLGGDLRIDRSARDGACFELRLKLDRP